MTGTGPLNPNQSFIADMLSAVPKDPPAPTETPHSAPTPEPEITPEDMMKTASSIMGGMASGYVAFVEETQSEQQASIDESQIEFQEFVDQATPEITKLGSTIIQHASNITGNPLLQVATRTAVESNSEIALLGIEIQTESALLNGKQREVKATQDDLDTVKSFQAQLSSPQSDQSAGGEGFFVFEMVKDFKQLTEDFPTSIVSTDEEITPIGPPPKIELRYTHGTATDNTEPFSTETPGETTRVSASLESGVPEIFINDRKMDGQTALEFITGWIGQRVDYAENQLEIKKQEQTAIEERLVGKVNLLKSTEQKRDQAIADVRRIVQNLPPDQQKQGQELLRNLEKQTQITDEVAAKAIAEAFKALENSGYSPEQIQQMFANEDEDSQDSGNIILQNNVPSGLSSREDEDSQTATLNQAETSEQEQARLEQVFQDKKELQNLAQEQIERQNLLEKLNRERLEAEHQADLMDVKRAQMDKELAVRDLEKMMDD